MDAFEVVIASRWGDAILQKIKYLTLVGAQHRGHVGLRERKGDFNLVLAQNFSTPKGFAYFYCCNPLEKITKLLPDEYCFRVFIEIFRGEEKTPKTCNSLIF